MYIEEFLKFESDHNLFDKTIDNIKFWHFIRKYVFENIIKQKENIKEAHLVGNNDFISNRILTRIKQIPSATYRIPLNLKKKDFLIINHHRRVKEQNYYRCIYTEELLSELKESSYYVFEDPMVDFHYRPISTKNLKYLDYIHNKYALTRVVCKILNKSIIRNSDKKEIEKIIDLINLKFNVNLNKNNLVSDIQNQLLKYKVFRKYFEKIIDKVSPKVIIEVVSYDFSRMVINEIASEIGIPVVELQHGTMGKYHIAYNFTNKMDLSTFPDYVFTFGQFWKDNTRLPIPEDRIKVVGWPYFEQKVNEYKQKYEKKQEVRKSILFISQGTIGKELSKIALNMSKMINKSKYKIVYKLHPGEYARWKSEYPWLIGADFEVVDNNQNDMHYYFSKSDIQIGVYSTALFEGLGYELKTYIVKLYGYQFMEELYNNKIAHLVTDEIEILKLINKEELVHEDFDINYLWEKNSINKILLEIDSIINKGLDHNNEN